MIDQNAQLHELPDYWQEQIRKIRSQNFELRRRALAAERIELSPKWQKQLAELRRENARFRVERNEARAELAALRAELEAGRGA